MQEHDLLHNVGYRLQINQNLFKLTTVIEGSQEALCVIPNALHKGNANALIALILVKPTIKNKITISHKNI